MEYNYIIIQASGGKKYIIKKMKASYMTLCQCSVSSTNNKNIFFIVFIIIQCFVQLEDIVHMFPVAHQQSTAFGAFSACR